MATVKRLQAAEQSAYFGETVDGQQGNVRAQARRRTAAIVGALFLFSNVTFLLGSVVFVESILGSADYLTLIATSRGQVVWGVLLELMNAVAYLGIAALMYPILRRRFESLALAYVGFRILEFVAQILAGLSPLVLLTLSEDFAGAGVADAGALAVAGSLLLAGRFWAFQIVTLTFALGALLFYIMLYRLRLVPRFLSLWGLVGSIVVATTLLDMFGAAPAFLGYLSLIMLLNELFLGLWLIVKGFNQHESR